MRLWLITVGEPLPTDAGNDRPLRTGLLAGLAHRRGNDVVWWTSAFDHVRKRHRERFAASGRIRLLHSRGYRRNVSLRRLGDHRDLARDFRRQAQCEPPPDVILCSLPTIELCVEAVEYGRRTGTPVVIDVRDLWPDAIIDLAPAWARPAAAWLLTPLDRATRTALAGATAITGITEDVVAWGLDQAGRRRSGRDRAFPLAYSRQEPPVADRRRAEMFWHSRGLTGNEFAVCFFGSVGRHFEWDTVIEAAKRLNGSGRDIRLVLCGAGPELDRCRRRARGVPNVDFAGWVGAAEIRTLMEQSAVGLAPYVSSRDFQLSLPNKSIEYLSAGLPIVSSLQGRLAALLAEHDCGITYANGNSEELAQAILELHDDPSRRRELSGRARSLYDRQFVAETVYGDMLDWLASIAVTKPAHRAA